MSKEEETIELCDDEDSGIEQEEEDDLQSQSPAQKTFVQNCDLQTVQDDNKVQLITTEIPRQMELMFILFSFYKDEVAECGYEFNCKAKISLNKIRIISNNNSLNDVEKCKAKLLEFTQKVIFTELTHENRHKIYLSPYFRAKANQKGFGLFKFNRKVYCYSKKLNEKDIKVKMKDIFWGPKIFAVAIKSVKSKEKEIYNHLRFFLKKMKEYHSDEFSKRSVIVELNLTENKINCIGAKERDLVAVKNILKNLLESCVILIAKYESSALAQVDEKVKCLKQFVKKKSTFPFHISRLQKKSIVLISKENVLRKILEKQKTIELLEINKNTQLGMFLHRRANYNERKIMIEQFCTKKGYDFTGLGTVYFYFKKMFIHQDEPIDSKQLIDLIKDVLDAIKQFKQKYQVPSQFIENKQNTPKEIQVMTGEFYSVGEVFMDKQLGKILKRDVLKEILRMSKPALIQYNVFEAQEIKPVYWFKDQKQANVQCAVSDMEPGVDYFEGRMKKEGEKQQYFFEAKLTVM